MSKPSANKANDAAQKLTQQQEDLDKREQTIREEESAVHHLRKLKEDLLQATAQLAKREDKLTSTEARMMIAKEEELGTRRSHLELELSAVKATVNDILISNFIKSVEQSIQLAMSDMEKRARVVEEMETKMVEERRTLNEEQALLSQKQQDVNLYLSDERDSIRKAREQLNQDKATLAAALAEEKSREEERDMYNKLIHDLEINDERVRRHLRAIEDELDIRRLKMDVETEDLRKNVEELSIQMNDMKVTEAQLEQDRSQMKAEKQNMTTMIARLNDREQAMTEKSNEIQQAKQALQHDRSKLFREQQELNQTLALNEALKREAEIDGIRNEAVAAKTLELKSEVDSANASLEDRQAYLESWEMELNNREEEYSRLVEQTISIPKLHQSSNEYQNVSSGVVRMQSRRMKEHYLVGQQRRVFSASVKRGSSATAGYANPYRTVLASTEPATSNQPTQQPQPKMTIEDLAKIRQAEDESNGIRVADDDDYNSEDDKIVVSSALLQVDTDKTPIDKVLAETEKRSERSHSSSSHRSSATSRSVSSLSHSSRSVTRENVPSPIPASHTPTSTKVAIGADPSIEKLINIKAAGVNSRTLLPPMSATPTAKKAAARQSAVPQQRTAMSTQRWTADLKHSPAATEANLATSSRICSLSHTVSELQRSFHRYAAQANLLVSDRDQTDIDRFYKRVSPSQRADIETAIWCERSAAQDLGIRRHFNVCPVIVEKEFTTNPVEMIRKVTKWWVKVEESLQHSDERSLQSRMDLLDRAVEALSQALDRSDDITQTGTNRLAGSSAVHSVGTGSNMWAGGGAAATLSARRFQKHSRPATASGTETASLVKPRLNLQSLLKEM